MIKKFSFSISGMTCVVCAGTCQKAILKLDGVKDCNVNFASGKAMVEYDNQLLSEQDIYEAVRKAGYKVVIDSNTTKQKGLGKLIAMLCCAFALLVFAMGAMIGIPYPSFLAPESSPVVFCIIQIILCLPVIIMGYGFYLRGFGNLIKLKPNMDSLVAISTTTAFLYSVYNFVLVCMGHTHNVHNLYFESVGVIIAIISLGKFLEAKSLKKTGDAIKKLTMLTPSNATVLRNGQWVEIQSKDVLIDDIVLVKAGESFCQDGIIVEGECSVNESMLTGESLPVDKKVGDKVYGGTVNGNGITKFRATSIGNDTVLSKIIRLVEQAQNSKAPIARLADKVSGVFVPAVMMIAVIVGIIWTIAMGSAFAIKIFVSVLVIACPCALGLATPTAIITGIGRGAKEGVLFRDAQGLEMLAHIDTIVFDKTGTITNGTPVVVDKFIIGDEQKTEAYTRAVESMSEHPLAKALVNSIGENNLVVGNIEVLSGRGIKAVINGEEVVCGNTKLMQEENIDISTVSDKLNDYQNNGYSIIIVAIARKTCGIFAIADTIKSNAVDTIKSIKELGIDVVLLSGDNQKVAQNIAQKVGIDNVIAQVMPEQKAYEIEKLMSQGKKVAMVGDGINDAPALAKANVGIAMGNGSDIAIESGQVVCVGGQIESVLNSLKLARATMRNIKQNLFWAFIYNIIGIPIACGILYPLTGYVMSPMLGGLAMSLSSISVVSNALRLNMYKFGKKKTLDNKTQEQAQMSNKCELTTCNIQEVSNQLIKENNLSNQTDKEENTNMQIIVKGMMCMHCENRVNKVVGALDGVKSVKADHNNNLVEVEFDGNVIDIEKIKSVIKEEGYEVE